MNTQADRRMLSRRGFTILELLIATAATLIIMGALTRAFGLVGNSIRDSRAEVQLSAQSRDLMFGLRSELTALTASMDPSSPDAGTGYFVYHEGPTSDSTTTTYFGTGPTVVQPGYFPLSRWGDTDDYLAFTVKAPKDAPFTGVVPWGVLEAARAQALGGSYSMPSGYSPGTPQIIRSQFAEVVYWMGPRMARTPTGGLIYEADDGDSSDGMLELGSPQYVDVDGDDFPDEFVLYRRVLLVRPDLNVTSQQLTAAGAAQVGFGSLLSDQEVVGYLRADGSVEPCGFSVPTLSPGAWNPGGAGTLGDAPNWLVGMALVQQSMDLSVAREMIHDANTLSTGRPSSSYSANTMESLRDPHRRFAHVMVPSAVTFSPQLTAISAEGCSMPLLALSPPTKFLARGPTPPVTTPTLNLTQSSGSTDCDHFTMIGHLRPEFALGGLREGEDIVSPNALAFDLQVFDPGAPVFITVGPDGAPGVPGDGTNNPAPNPDPGDDNQNGIDDDLGELGAMQSDDQVVTPRDPFFYAVSRDTTLGAVVSRGTYVDLGYAQQPGSNLRFGINDATLGRVQGGYFSILSSPYSGVTITGNTNTYDSDISEGLRRSGKFVIRSNGQGFVQQTYDTWTSGYEHDGLNQVATGVFTDVFNTSDVQATYWVFNGRLNPPPAVSPSNPAPSYGGDAPDPSNSILLADGSLKSDAAPPYSDPLQSLKISFRNYDVGTRQIDQLDVIKDFN